MNVTTTPVEPLQKPRSRLWLWLLFAAILAVILLIAWMKYDTFQSTRILYRVFIIGDSITAGKGDQKPNGGGYVARVRQLLPQVEFTVLAYPGKTSLEIDDLSQHDISASPQLAQAINDADLILFAGGINDYWDKVSPYSTVRRIRKVCSEFKTRYPRAHVVAASLLTPTDQYHNTWVFQTNRFLMSKAFMNLEVGPLFHTLPLDELSEDGLHPGAKGYDTLATNLRDYLCQELPLLYPDRRSMAQCLTPRPNGVRVTP